MPEPTRFSVNVPADLLTALEGAAELYILLWPGDPPRIILTALPDRRQRIVPATYKEVPARLIIGPAHGRRAGGHWRSPAA